MIRAVTNPFPRPNAATMRPALTRMMKTTLCSLFAVLLGCFHACITVAAPEASPRFKARVTCFNGAADHSSYGSGTCFQPDGTLHTEGKMACGIPGQISEITWSFVAQHGGKDVYRFVRRFPLDATDAPTTSKEVEFSDSRVVIFKDEHQTIVIEPPKP